MKTVERKLNKAQIATICLLIISVLLTGAYFTVLAIVNKLAEGSGSGDGTRPEIMEGEGTYLNQLVAYPSIEEGNITFIEVKNPKGHFGVSRYPDDKGDFLFHYYVDGKEGAVPYTPPICGAEGNFDYKSLYAQETGDGYGMIYYLTYLCAAIGTPYFTERIELPSTDTEEGKAKREALLREYGLTQSEVSMVSFTYGERDPETGNIKGDSVGAHVVIIGDKALSGKGFYFMVDGRDCVYYTGSEYFAYALNGFNEFIKGMLVAEGLDGESVYGPYLTTDFKEWIGTVFKEESDRVFTSDDEAYKKYTNPNVITNGSYSVSIDKGLDFVPDSPDFSGYEYEEGQTLSFDLEALKSHTDYTRIKNTLKGKNVGSYLGNEIVLTLLSELNESDEKILNFTDEDTVRYEYSISKIEAVITDNAEITSGTTDSASSLLKVTYRYTVGGQTVKYDCHGVIDTSHLDPTEAAKLSGLTIGEELAEAVRVTVDYTKENSLELSEKYVLTGVTSIFDEKGQLTDTITESTYVNISYRHTVGNGQSKTGTALIKLQDIKDDDKLAPLKTLLLGKGKGSYSQTIYNQKFNYEFMRDFVTYKISEIEYFVANEIIVSFRFENASKRDPFYGETFFTNTLTNEYKLYGLNSGTCETAVKLLGGIGTDSNSAVGLSGTTVAIGLSLENMEKYGLFAHKIYFEMPRGIFDASENEEEANDSDELSDYDWVYTLGFNLYISDPVYDEDGTRIRYIGSDMYDIIAKVPASDFDFVEYGFTEFWGRKNMIMMDLKKVHELKLEFNMQDLTGEYDFNIVFKDAYAGYVNGELVIRDEAVTGFSKITHQVVTAKASDDAFDTVFKEMFGAQGWYNLATLYDNTLGGGKTSYYPGSKDTLGASYFNSAYEILLMTRYLDILTEEEQQAGHTKPKIMSMKIASENVDGEIVRYTYDFYRIDDRRIMVSLYKSDEDGNMIIADGEVSDYYISTFSFKKLVNCYIRLLNGEDFDESLNYG